MTEAVAGLLAALIPAMEAFVWVQRRYHPPDLSCLAEELTPFGDRLARAVEAFDAVDWPEHLASDVGRLKEAAARARETVQLMTELPPGNEVFGAYCALRRSIRCYELLYPLVPGRLLLAPTSRDRTWSLQRPALDGEELRQKIHWIGEHWHLDREHVLLTGISDGATFGLLCGLLPDQPYTHLAPLSGVLAPLDEAQQRNAAGKPI